MNDNQERIKCTNCNHYAPHYTRAGKYLFATQCGHCTERNFSSSKNKKFPFRNGCELWEPITEEETIDYTVKSLLQDIRENLEKVTILLNIK